MSAAEKNSYCVQDELCNSTKISCCRTTYIRAWHSMIVALFRDVPCRAVPGSGGSVPCQIFPCRALMIRAVPNISVPCRARIWWIHAVPNISAPCPYDPCRSVPCRGVPAQVFRFSRNQDLGTKILVPRSGVKFFVPQSW